jgi:WD40 repeat protein
MHPKWCDAVAFAPNGGMLASASRDKTVIIYTLNGDAWERRLKLVHAAPVNSVAFAPDGNTLASASAFAVTIWHAYSGELLQEPAHPSSVYCVAFSAHTEGVVLASGCCDGTVHCFQAARLELRAVLRGHQGVVRALHFSRCGRFLASASDDGQGIVWATETARLLSALDFLRARLRILHRSGVPIVAPGSHTEGGHTGSTAYWIERVCSAHLLPENAVNIVLSHLGRPATSMAAECMLQSHGDFKFN